MKRKFLSETPSCLVSPWNSIDRPGCDGLATVGLALLAHTWIRIQTTEDPYEHTLREQWSAAEFDDTVLGIQRIGYRVASGSGFQIRLDVNDYFYWTTGEPFSATAQIHRRPRQPSTHPAPYDAVAARYDATFSSSVFIEENEALAARLGDLSHLRVLDIGCGTGVLLDCRSPRVYLGIDPAMKMLERLHAKHPRSDRVQTLHTTLGAFVSAVRFDLALALFGTASYLTDAELVRLPCLLAPGGRAVLMFYAPGYVPITHRILGVSAPTQQRAPIGKTSRFGNYDLLEIQT